MFTGRDFDLKLKISVFYSIVLTFAGMGLTLN